MTDLPHNSIDPTQSAVNHAANLLRHYSFELDITVEQQMAAWLKTYSAQWILSSVVEALYQGRYKAVSVEQILQIWQRRGQPLFHFTSEFERLVRSEIPSAIAPLPPSSTAQVEPLPQPTLSYRTLLLQLPSAKAAFKLKRLTEIPSLTFPLNGETPGQSHKVSASTSNSAGVPVVAELTSTHSSKNGAIAPEFNGSELNGKLILPEDHDGEFQQFKEGVIFALSSSLASHRLHPVIRLQLSQHYQLNWQHFLDCQAPCI